MVDPSGLSTGLAPWAVGKALEVLLEELYKEYKHIKDCEKECAAFTEQLKSLQKFVDDVDAMNQQNKSDFLTKWWNDVHECLTESLTLPPSLQPAQHCCDLWSCNSRRKLRKSILHQKVKLENLIGKAEHEKVTMLQLVNITTNVDAVATTVTDGVKEMKKDLSANVDKVATTVTDGVKEMKKDLSANVDKTEHHVKEGVKEIKQNLGAKVDEMKVEINCHMVEISQKEQHVGAKVDEVSREVNEIKCQMVEITQTEQHLVAKVDKMDVTMNELKQYLVDSTKRYMSDDGGSNQAIVAHIRSMHSFGRNDEIEKQIIDGASTYASSDEHVIGREEMIIKLKTCLLDHQDMKIIALYGCGGAGKTCIVQQLVQDHQVKMHFKNVFWTAVGRDLEMLDLKAKVEHQIKGKDGGLIVLDDIWRINTITFIEASKYNSFRFIITTRQLNEIEGCEEIHKVHVQMLSETQSWDLFCHHAFPFRKKDHIPHDDLKGIAENIARECKGLPLALKVIGTAMSNKRTSFEWNTALDRLRGQEIIDDDQDKKLIQVLRLSYDALESMETFAGKVRECFLYFGAFREDEEIDVESLMNCWVGEGLLKNDTSPLNQTYMVLGVLIGSCLVEKVPNNEKGCKIHDVLRDLTFQISKKVRPYEDHFQANATRQHDQTHYDKVVRIFWSHTEKLPVQISAPKLKVLLLDHSSVSEEFLSRSLPSLCSLQILSLRRTEIRYLPKSLGELQHLVVLDLSFSMIEVLPFSLGKLKKLNVLNLHKCQSLQKLPKNVFLNLKSLKVLQFSSWSQQHLPLNLESMTELTILYMTCPINDLEPLNKLNKLEELVVEDSMLTRLPDWVCQCSSLTSLKISTQDPKAYYFPPLKALSRLRILHLHGWESLVSLPKLPCLEVLDIKDCHSLESLLDPEDDVNCSLRVLSVEHCKKLCSIGSLSKMKSLKSLELCSCNTLKAFSDSEDEGNCCLQELKIFRCKKLSSKRFGPFPKLKYLSIVECELFIKLPDAQAFPLVTCLIISRDYYRREYSSEDDSYSEDTEVGWEIEIPKSWVVPGSLCNLKRLEVKRFQRVKMPKLIAKGALPSLEYLKVDHVEVLPVIEKGSLPSLKRLYVAYVELLPIIEKGSLPALETFNCRFQDGIIEIPDSFWQFLDNLPQLKFLVLVSFDIKSFEEWRSIQMPKNLSVGGFRCKRLPASMGRKGSQFDSLEVLNLYDLDELETLPEVEASALPKLSSLNILRCRRLVIPEYYNRYEIDPIIEA